MVQEGLKPETEITDSCFKVIILEIILLQFFYLFIYCLITEGICTLVQTVNVMLFKTSAKKCNTFFHS